MKIGSQVVVPEIPRVAWWDEEKCEWSTEGISEIRLKGCCWFQYKDSFFCLCNPVMSVVCPLCVQMSIVAVVRYALCVCIHLKIIFFFFFSF